MTMVIVTVTVTVIMSDRQGDSYSLNLRCGSMRNFGLSHSDAMVRSRFSSFRYLRRGEYRGSG